MKTSPFRRTRSHWWTVGLLALTGAGCATGSNGNNSVSSWGPWGSVNGMRVSSSVPEEPPPKKVNESKVHLAYGQYQERTGQHADARKSYQTVLDRQPKNVEALIGLARLDLLSDRFTQAEERLNKAAKIAPKDPQVCAARGQLYARQDRWDLAATEYRRGIDLSPEDPMLRMLLGTALVRSGDVDGGLTEFTRAVGNAEAHYNVAYLLHEQGSLPACADHLTQALQLKPDLEQAIALQQQLQARTAVADTREKSDRMPSTEASERSIQRVGYRR